MRLAGYGLDELADQPRHRMNVRYWKGSMAGIGRHNIGRLPVWVNRVGSPYTSGPPLPKSANNRCLACSEARMGRAAPCRGLSKSAVTVSCPEQQTLN